MKSELCNLFVISTYANRVFLSILNLRWLKQRLRAVEVFIFTSLKSHTI